ncbi:hypothetical protein SOVF_195460 [Spinacia oleracea]|nr:hypothetical protein SOVF_195460 [Spinacia oleracea]
MYSSQVKPGGGLKINATDLGAPVPAATKSVCCGS